jgi:hypothetical protein
VWKFLTTICHGKHCQSSKHHAWLKTYFHILLADLMLILQYYYCICTALLQSIGRNITIIALVNWLIEC